MKINFKVYGIKWKGYIFSRLHGWDLVWFSYNYSTSRIQRYQEETISPYSEMTEKARDLMKRWMILGLLFFLLEISSETKSIYYSFLIAASNFAVPSALGGAHECGWHRLLVPWPTVILILQFVPATSLFRQLLSFLSPDFDVG